MKKLRIGIIDFLNLHPIYEMLRQTTDSGRYEFVSGHPAHLNGLLRTEEIDISPASSVEFLREQNGYSFLPDNSISCLGPIGSIMLFSRQPIEALNGQTVYTTHRSATSPVLLEVLTRKFYGVEVRRLITEEPFYDALTNHSAYLSIGDEALVAAHEAQPIAGGPITGKDYLVCSIARQSFHLYDLGHLWHVHTGLPFVFALWTYKKSVYEKKKEEFARLTKDLESARSRAVENLSSLSLSAPLSGRLTPEGVLSYWRGIRYGLGEKEKEGLALFDRYIKEFGL